MHFDHDWLCGNMGGQEKNNAIRDQKSATQYADPYNSYFPTTSHKHVVPTKAAVSLGEFWPRGDVRYEMPFMQRAPPQRLKNKKTKDKTPTENIKEKLTQFRDSLEIIDTHIHHDNNHGIDSKERIDRRQSQHFEDRAPEPRSILMSSQTDEHNYFDFPFKMKDGRFISTREQSDIQIIKRKRDKKNQTGAIAADYVVNVSSEHFPYAPAEKRLTVEKLASTITIPDAGY